MIMDLCLLGVGPFVWLGGIKYTSVTVHAHIYIQSSPSPTSLIHKQREREGEVCQLVSYKSFATAGVSHPQYQLSEIITSIAFEMK